MTDPEPKPTIKRQTTGVPPLAWIVIAALLVIGAIALFGNNGVRQPPSGGPVAPQDLPDAPTVIDPAPLPPPATPAPATPPA